MELPWYVKKQPQWVNRLLGKRVAHSIYPFIFLPPEIYTDLQSEHPKFEHRALLVHEEEHRKAQRKNPIGFWMRYVFSSRFREQEEVKAVKAAIVYLKQNHVSVVFTESDDVYALDTLFLYPVSKWYSCKEVRALINAGESES